MSGQTPYDGMLGPTPFGDAVDAAIARENKRFEDPEVLAAERATAHENAERWRAIHAAQEAAGGHAVVLPLATAKAILAALKGEPNTLDDFKPGLTTLSLSNEIVMTEARA